MRTHTIIVALAVAASLASADIVAVQQVVARSGQAIPGGGTLGPLFPATLQGVSPGGHACFITTLEGTPGAPRTAFAWSPFLTSPRAVLRTNDIAPGWPQPASVQAIDRVAIDDAGRLLLSARVSPITVGSVGLWRESSGGLMLQVRDGAPLPSGGAAIDQINEQGTMAGDGVLSIGVGFAGEPSASDEAIVLLSTSGTRVVLREGQVPPPWSGACPEPVVLSLPNLPDVGTGERWLTRASTGCSPTALLVGQGGGAPGAIATVGGVLPGMAIGQTIAALNPGTISNAGEVAFAATYTGIASGAFARDSGGVLRLLLQSGQAVPTSVGTVTISLVASSPHAAIVGNGGDVLVLALANVPGAGTVNTLFQTRVQGGTPALVAHQGQVVPDRGLTIQTISTDSLGIDERGNVVFLALVRASGSTTNRRAILTWSPALGLSTYAVAGLDTVLFTLSDGRQVSDLALRLTVPGPVSTAVRRFLADDGRFVWQALFEDGSSALLVGAAGPVCDSIDFNQDGLFPADDDLADFLSVFAGGPCSTGDCTDIDFNNDELFPDDADLIAFLRVLAGGQC